MKRMNLLFFFITALLAYPQFAWLFSFFTTENQSEAFVKFGNFFPGTVQNCFLENGTTTLLSLFALCLINGFCAIFYSQRVDAKSWVGKLLLLINLGIGAMYLIENM